LAVFCQVLFLFLETLWKHLKGLIQNSSYKTESDLISSFKFDYIYRRNTHSSHECLDNFLP
jgi:hypothetical protein